MKMRLWIAVLLLTVLSTVVGPSSPPPSILLQGGLVVDGSGSPGRTANVRIVGDTIQAVGKLKPREGEKILDATNLVVAPGFIDLLGQSEFNVLVDPRAASKVLQGVTTEVTGEGSAIAPLHPRAAQADAG